MKENKSPAVDGIPPKRLKELVGQNTTPLAHVFNLSLQEGEFPLEWIEANILILQQKKVNKQVGKLSRSHHGAFAIICLKCQLYMLQYKSCDTKLLINLPPILDPVTSSSNPPPPMIMSL